MPKWLPKLTSFYDRCSIEFCFQLGASEPRRLLQRETPIRISIFLDDSHSFFTSEQRQTANSKSAQALLSVHALSLVFLKRREHSRQIVRHVGGMRPSPCLYPSNAAGHNTISKACASCNDNMEQYWRSQHEAIIVVPTWVHVEVQHGSEFSLKSTGFVARPRGIPRNRYSKETVKE